MEQGIAAQEAGAQQRQKEMDSMPNMGALTDMTNTIHSMSSSVKQR
jgi:hypothetical protein